MEIKRIKPRRRRKVKPIKVGPGSVPPDNEPDQRVGYIDPAMRKARHMLALAAHDVEFANAAITTRITVVPAGFYVYIDSKERDSGEDTRLQIRWDLPAAFSSREHAIGWIYACVREAWVHELNEAMFVDGVRRRDLHRESGGTTRPPEEIESIRIEVNAVRSQLLAFLTNNLEKY